MKAFQGFGGRMARVVSASGMKRLTAAGMFGLVIATAGMIWQPPVANGATLYVCDTFGGVGKYTDTGATINANLIADTAPLTGDFAVALDGQGHLFVNTDDGNYNGFVSEYTTDGAVVHQNLIAAPGLTQLSGLAVEGTHLFVADYNQGRISEYDTAGNVVDYDAISVHNVHYIASDGDGHVYAVYEGDDGDPDRVGEYTVDTSSGNVTSSSPSLIYPIYSATGIALDGQGHIFVSWNGRVGEYNTDGSVVNDNLVSNLMQPRGLAFADNVLYVAETGRNRVGAYTIANGSVVSSNADLISVSDPVSLAVDETPEPATLALMVVGGALLACRRPRRICG